MGSDTAPDQKSEINSNELFKYLYTPGKIVYFQRNKFLLVVILPFIRSEMHTNDERQRRVIINNNLHKHEFERILEFRQLPTNYHIETLPHVHTCAHDTNESIDTLRPVHASRLISYQNRSVDGMDAR